MGKKFTQLTNNERIAISHLLRANISVNTIATQLGKHRSSIYREIARNKTSKGYFPFPAERKLEARRKRSFKLNRETKLRDFIFNHLQRGWSPAGIAGRLKLESNGESIISPETIYNYIYSDFGVRNRYYKFLKQKRMFRYPKIHRKKKIPIPNRTPISARSKAINKRLELGHWEGDLMHFKKGNRVNLITLRERVSRYMVAIKNPSKNAIITVNNIIERLKKISSKIIKSITFDNGTEFSAHEKIIKELNAQTYFCEPYKSFQKGSIENGNNELRRWLPRDCDIQNIRSKRIKDCVKDLNNKPMKCLGYRTPAEVLFGGKIKFVVGF